MNESKMNIDKSIQQIREDIETWNEIRQTEVALNQLTSGYGLEINRQEFQNWIPLVEGHEEAKIHLYLASNSGKLIFYLVDSVTDSSGDDEHYRLGENLFIKGFYREMNHSNTTSTISIPKIKMDKIEVVEAAFQWFLYSRYWFAKKLNTSEEMVRVFSIPFNDFLKVFDKHEVTSAFLFFCLESFESKEETHQDEISIFLCSKFEPSKDRITNYSPRVYENVGVPRPPFKIVANQFGLLS
jgi:hypothetical protein